MHSRLDTVCPLVAMPPRPRATWWPAFVLAVGGLLFAGEAAAQARIGALRGVDVQKVANGILSLMSYTVTPDVTTSSLSISNAATASPGIMMTQFGGGFTWSRDTPLYLEGNAAYSRYDPVFIASDGAEERTVPAKWNSATLTGGIGWDFRLSPTWVVRPIFNFTIGYVASDMQIARWFIENETNADLAFLDGGKLRASGAGGSLMLDFEDYKPEREIDFEGRYAYVPLRSYSNTSEGVQGEAVSESLNLWARWRAPTGWHAMDRPIRYVLEATHTHFLGSQAGVLGFDQLNCLGVGLELDSSAHDILFTRWRMVLRHVFGPNVAGWSVGLAVSF